MRQPWHVWANGILAFNSTLSRSRTNPHRYGNVNPWQQAAKLWSAAARALRRRRALFVRFRARGPTSESGRLLTIAKRKVHHRSPNLTQRCRHVQAECLPFASPAHPARSLRASAPVILSSPDRSMVARRRPGA